MNRILKNIHNNSDIILAIYLNTKEGISFKDELLDFNESMAVFTSSAVI